MDPGCHLKKKQTKPHIPDKCVSFVLKNPNFLDIAEGCEGLLHDLLAEAVGDAAAVDGAVGLTALIVNFVKRQRFTVCCK